MFRAPMARFGTVALIGRSNVGKSTFLNAALGEPLAIVSATPQTTRDALLGVVTREGVQIAFVDTPGVHQPKTELGRRMNAHAEEAARTADLILFMTDVKAVQRRAGKLRRVGAQPPADMIDAGDQKLLERLPDGIPIVVLVNMIDKLGDKALMLPLLEQFTARPQIATVIPVCSLKSDDVERVLEQLAEWLPEQEPSYDAETLTDRPTRYFAAEFVREQVLLLTSREVPHACAVSIDAFVESPTNVSISATLHVEKEGQRKILIGRGGSKIGEIGQSARARIAKLVGKRVHLELFVKLTPSWKDVPRQLAELGYAQASTSGAAYEGIVRKPRTRPASKDRKPQGKSPERDPKPREVAPREDKPREVTTRDPKPREANRAPAAREPARAPREDNRAARPAPRDGNAAKPAPRAGAQPRGKGPARSGERPAAAPSGERRANPRRPVAGAHGRTDAARAAVATPAPKASGERRPAKGASTQSARSSSAQSARSPRSDKGRR